MELFDTKKVQKYAPNDADFLNKSLSLFKTELINFIASFEKANLSEDLSELKLRIHKIKPSCELFDLPQDILQDLNEIYHYDQSEKLVEKEISEKLSFILNFFSKLILEINNFLSK